MQAKPKVGPVLFCVALITAGCGSSATSEDEATDDTNSTPGIIYSANCSNTSYTSWADPLRDWA
jgi:hypothetical protein